VAEAVSRSTGDVVVLLDARCEVRSGWLADLRLELAEHDVAAVQPLVLQPDDTIAAAGMAGRGSGVPLLAGHPPEDALRLKGHRVPALSDAAVAVRAEEAVAVLAPGFPGAEPAGTPAGARPSRRSGFRVAPTSWVTFHRKTQDGPLHAGGPPPHPALAGLCRPREVSEQLRWSIKLPSPPGPAGDRWGDTHYAAAFAGALRRLQQDVVTRRRGAHTAGPTHLDDVSLALRGRHPIPPTPGQLNVLWVISHPEAVDPAEFAGYDLVCAASTAWSHEMSVRTGREVMPLLQATAFHRSAGPAPASGAGAGVVFVGTNRGRRERPLVWQAVEAGVPLSVYGPGWEELPDGIWQGEYVANDRLPDLYRQHGIVLADHWPDMARHGFIANRVFDAVAVGAKVLSDDVVGLHDTFDPRDVVIVRTPDEIRRAVADLRAGGATPYAERLELSFDARAATLLDRVSRL
jgi:hypothetical protein